jgi:hypothetical protein
MFLQFEFLKHFTHFIEIRVIVASSQITSNRCVVVPAVSNNMAARLAVFREILAPLTVATQMRYIHSFGKDV